MSAIGLLLPLLLVLALAVVLAFEALKATRSHRRSAERTLGDYANFAAFIVSNVAQQEIDRRLLYAFAPVRRWEAASGAPLPEPSVLGQDPSEASRCASAGLDPPTYLRLDLATDSLAVAGRDLSGTTRSWLADTLRIVARQDDATAVFHHIFGNAPGAGLVAWTAVRDSTGHTLALYAKTSCLLVDGRPLFDLAMHATPALPPSLTGSAPNDSLFSWRLVDPGGQVIQASVGQYASRFVGSAGPLPLLGDATLHTAIRPDLADRLVIGGIPYSRVPLALLLLVLVVLFAGLTILQVRRLHLLMRLRERFVSNVSHELRTPLQQILVFSELLRMERIESATERRQSLEIVERETRRLIELVDNVLRFSRAARGEDALRIEAVALGPLVRETVHAFEPLARARDASVRHETGSDVIALADPNALRRVLLNLLDNAVKYGPAGQTVTVSISSSDGRAVLRVDDEGPGIPLSERERIFQPFHRLEREERAAIAGSGVGLSIVRDLVTRMKGSVSAEVAPGGGARLTVTLPGTVDA